MTEPIQDAEIVEDVADEKITITRGTIARAGIKFMATSSVRFVVSSAITTLVPTETTKDKRKVFVASMVLSGIINEKVKDYVNTEIDEQVEYAKMVMAKVRELQATQDASTTTEQ